MKGYHTEMDKYYSWKKRWTLKSMWQKCRRRRVEADASGTEAEAVLTEEEEPYVMDAVRLEKEIRNFPGWR